MMDGKLLYIFGIKYILFMNIFNAKRVKILYFVIASLIGGTLTFLVGFYFKNWTKRKIVAFSLLIYIVIIGVYWGFQMPILEGYWAFGVFQFMIMAFPAVFFAAYSVKRITKK
ncbi:MAG: hypothetical protein A2329_01550 [Sulfurimonas sp. RIFOXYB2_FULL_37_5]|nr:MAG: hypothetical protein A2329_01550 [Sulfurimonas sp. RIFOXYB2_FULL_37_5]